MLYIEIILFLLVGGIAGFLSGLLGIGGGVIVVPAMTWVLAWAGTPQSMLMHIAAGTSLAAMIITAIAAAWSHHKRGNVDWKMWSYLLPATLIGAVLGVWLASLLNTRVLSIIFACMLLLIALQILFFAKPEGHAKKSPHFFVTSIMGLIVGVASGLLGIGGGALLIPFLLFYNFPMNRTSGTSAACILPIALVGAIGFMITGSLHPLAMKLPYSTGFIYWPAFFGIAIGSVALVPVGTWLGAKVNKELLKKCFAVLLILIALELFFK